MAEDSREIFPEGPLTLPIPELDATQWDQMGLAVMNLIDINLGNRAGYDRMLDVSNAMYELRTLPRDVPWPNAANLTTPKVAEKVDEVTSRIIGTVFQPRLFTVSGNDPLSQQYAHTTEQFYNNEATRNNWIDPLETCVHLSARDGLGIAEVLWDLSIDEQVRYAENPFGGPRQKKIVKRVTYDAPRIQHVEARDFVMIPNYAPSVAAADATARKLYMNEADLWKAVAGGRGIFNAEAVEKALSYVGPAQGELSQDRQRASTYTIGGLISVSDNTVAAPEGVRMTRGPLEVWQVLTNQFYVDDDNRITSDPSKGKPQECFVWVHDRSRIMLGIAPYEYWGGRPYFDLALWPRPGRVYGFGVPWRIKGPVEEKNAIHIARLDYLDMAVQPMRWRTKAARFRDEDRRWGPDAEVEVTEGSGMQTKDFGFIGMPPWPTIGDGEEDRLDAMIEAVVSSPQAAAAVGGAPGGSQQRSARAAQTDAQLRGMASNMLNRRTRRWLQRIFIFITGLYQQYAPDQQETVAQTSGGAQKVIVPKEILSLDYTYGIAGMGGALDKEARRQDMMMLGQFLMQTPLLQGNIPRVWTMARMIVETFDIPEVTALIGTMDDAKQQAQSQAQAQEVGQKQQMIMALLQHSKSNIGGGGAHAPSPMKPFGGRM